MAVYAIDVIFVARLGTRRLAAATLGVFLFGLLMWALIGLTGACGAADRRRARRGARHAVREVRRIVPHGAVARRPVAVPRAA